MGGLAGYKTPKFAKKLHDINQVYFRNQGYDRWETR